MTALDELLEVFEHSPNFYTRDEIRDRLRAAIQEVVREELALARDDRGGGGE